VQAHFTELTISRRTRIYPFIPQISSSGVLIEPGEVASLHARLFGL